MLYGWRNLRKVSRFAPLRKWHIGVSLRLWKLARSLENESNESKDTPKEMGTPVFVAHRFIWAVE